MTLVTVTPDAADRGAQAGGLNIKGGIVWSNPTNVILNADPVSSYTNHNSATLFMPSPIWDTTWPENSRPKSLVLNKSHPDPVRSFTTLSWSATPTPSSMSSGPAPLTSSYPSRIPRYALVETVGQESKLGASASLS
jgi:hypothetical protein